MRLQNKIGLVNLLEVLNLEVGSCHEFEWH